MVRIKQLLLVLVTAVIGLLYVPLNRPWGRVHELALPIDGRIPIIPAFLVAYLGLFWLMVIGGITWVMLRHPASLGRLCASIIVANLIAFSVYFSFQTMVPRTVDPGMGFFADALRWLWQRDHMYSAFPSGHTYTTIIMTWFLWQVVPRWWKAALVINAALILLSTLFLHQHVVLDVAGGIVLGVAVAATVQWLFSIRTTKKAVAA